MPQFVEKTNCGIFGRGDGDRTHDLSVPNAARYQLRYASSQILFSEIHRRCFFHSFNKRKYYNKYERKSQSFSHENKKLFLFLFQSV